MANFDKGSIDNVYFYFTRIQEPVNKFESTEKEYKTTVAISKSDLNTLTSKFPKVKYATHSNDDFLESHKVEEVPFPESPVQYTVTFRQNELKKDGTPIADNMVPKVYLETRDGKVYDITTKYLVGNGSRGTVNYYEQETNYGTFLKLSNIKIDRLVKFEDNRPKNLSDIAEELPDDLDIDDLDVVVVDSKGEATEAPKAPTKEEIKSSRKSSAIPSDDALPF